MKLTKLQRHTAYILMMHELENGADFLCECAANLNIPKFDWDSKWIDRNFIRILPELYSKKPMNPYSTECWFHWSDKKSRKSIIKKCIEETY